MNTIKQRKKKDGIQKLLNDDSERIARTIKSYFDDMFCVKDGEYREVLNVVHPVVTDTDDEKLLLPFTKEEFREAIFYMHLDKSPGPDEFNLGFYQRFWSEIGDDVFTACCSWLDNLSFPRCLNVNNLVMVPKNDSPTSMKELKPIALCNVVYKIL